MSSVFFYKPPERHERDETNWHCWLSVWAPVAVAIAVICVESTATFSAQNTSSWLRPITERILGMMSDSGWESFHHLLRKTGHFMGYGPVGSTFLRRGLSTLSRPAPP